MVCCETSMFDDGIEEEIRRRAVDDDGLVKYWANNLSIMKKEVSQ